MKIGLIGLLAASILAGIPVHAQDVQKISLVKKNAPLEDIFKEFERQTNCHISCQTAGWLPKAEKQNISLRNASLMKAMEVCLKEQPFVDTIVGNFVTVSVKDISGKVINEQYEPLDGVLVTIKGTAKTTTTNSKGEFALVNPPVGDSLIFTSVNAETRTMKIPRTHCITVPMKNKVVEYCTVTVHNGYQETPRDKAGGAYANPDKDLLSHPVNSNITYWLDGRIPGVQLNKNITPGTNQSLLSIRSPGTIVANSAPLIVIDNFPFEGDINNINPNDIENITVLKDAAAAAIWGTRAGNGVIIINTKKGCLKQLPKLEFSIRTDIVLKPSLHYSRDFTDASDYIGFEELLFSRGYYDATLSDPSYPAVSPVVELLSQIRAGTLSVPSGTAQIDLLKKNDVRTDLARYAYRKAINQGYSFNISGGGDKNSYYFSLGYDRNPGNLVANDNERETLMLKNIYQPIKQLELAINIICMNSMTHDNNDGMLGVKYPYTKLADSRGNALAITTYLRDGYTDTAGNGRMLDWKYRPLQDLNMADNTLRSRDIFISGRLKYTIPGHSYFSISCLYSEGGTSRNNFYSVETYYTRNLINRFTQLNQETITKPLPLGGIRDEGNNLYSATNVRAQIGYNDTLGRGHHILTAMIGAEQPTLKTQTNASREYGITAGGQGDNMINYQSFFPVYNNPSDEERIDNPGTPSSAITNIISYYADIIYSFRRRYVLSLSARSDASNLYGVKTNDKAVPLWSASIVWDLRKEHFLDSSHLGECRIRLSDGYNGNFSNTASALTTIMMSGVSSYGTPTSVVVNPSNPSLRWEKINILNLGIDFSNFKNTIECTIDGYLKNGVDLIGYTQAELSTGVEGFLSNSASTTGHGIELSLKTTTAINKAIKWNSSFIFSYSFNKISHYAEQKLPLWQYMEPLLNKPLEGFSQYGIVSFKWRGLDPNNGDPQGELQGQVSKDYEAITTSKDRSQLVYNGPSTPAFFGGQCNTFSWKQWQVSLNITYKLGYYFRRTSINYSALATVSVLGNMDYKNRWQNPGDEKKTSIPSIPLQIDASRDIFYTDSEFLVTKADHIRLHDIFVSYDIDKEKLGKLPFRHLQVYLSAYNIAILWRANKYGIDPDYLAVNPDPLTISAGAKIIL